MDIRTLLCSACLLLASATFAAIPESLPGEPPAGTEIVFPVDGAIMVWVPAGEFIMGMDRDEADQAVKALGYKGWEDVWAWEWFPQRHVYIEGFFIDKYEATRAQWEQFAAATNFTSTLAAAKGPKETRPGEFALYPVSSVLWAEAQQYVNWAGKRLPYEAEWEKAARGTDGRLYPWGNALPTTDLGVFVDLKTKKHTIFEMVGSHPAGDSPYGCSDMAGNVYEWTCEWMEPYPNNPEYRRMLSYTGHTNGVLRGGSFYHGTHAYLCAKRFGFRPNETYYHVGFRAVWTPPPGYFTSADFAAAKAQVVVRKDELARLRVNGNPKAPLYF